MAKKSLGQNFLINHEVAKAEAAHSAGKNVLEMGPGHGVLTAELCKSASRVVAVEKDSSLMPYLHSKLHSRKLVLINKDFFDANAEELMLADTDIMISNIPYSLSSKTIEWLSMNGMQAVLCLQKEFVEHMLAKPGTRKYSKLSVISSLFFSITKIMDVAKGNFRPVPKVDSSVIYIKPRSNVKATPKELLVLSALMQHKKKNVRSALADSHSLLNTDKRELAAIGNKLENGAEKVFRLKPEELLELSGEISRQLH